jgi:membrane dipeptidase
VRPLTDKEEERARAIHQRAVVIDALNASIMDEDYWRKMRQGGVTAANYTVAMNHNLSETIKIMAQLGGQLAASKVAVPVESVADVHRAKEQGRVGIVFGFQNIGPLEGDLSLLPIFCRLGVRIIQLTYHFKNVCGDGCKEASDTGLSLFGCDLIARMNDLGMVVDLAHVGERTARDAIETSRHPAIASHSNAYARVPAYQNKTDDTIQALARKGGVICVTAFPRMLEPDPTVDTLLDHIDHIARLVGIDHVGLGLDFAEGWPDSPIHRKKLLAIDGKIYDYPPGIETISKLPNVTRGLVSRGYSDEDIEKILGGNLLRVFAQVIGSRELSGRRPPDGWRGTRVQAARRSRS